MKHEVVLILDFGGQYNQLIARRVRDLNVYSLVIPYDTKVEDILKYNPKGIIFTGGPNSCYLEGSPLVDKKIFDLNIPILGICYGSQMIAHLLGGKVKKADVSEYGKTNVYFNLESSLYKGINKEGICFMSHTDHIYSLPDDFIITSSSKDCPIASFEHKSKAIYAVQYHPEVEHSIYGKDILNNFLVNICKCSKDWKMHDFVNEKINELKNQIKDKKVLCALSGGVDSSVAAALLSKAVGKNLTCVFVDHGLLRKNESQEVCDIFGNNKNLNFIKIDAKKRFYNKLQGITDPESKRKIIGEEFIRVFEEEAKKIGKVDFFVQGTIYPDVIESGHGKSAVIKSHHNVGGLPSVVDFKEIIEPLRMLFKDEVRKLGLELELPEYLVYRQPFPGPGLGIRIIGEVTEEKVKIVQEADYIYRSILEKSGYSKNLGQYFAALTNMRSVGVMGDERTYDYAICLRAVLTTDFMTAYAAHIPFDLMDEISNKIVNEVKGVNRVLYDFTSKPPATIEFE